MTARRWAVAVAPLLVLLIALAGPWWPAPSTTAPLSAPFEPAGGEHLLGTDVLGRDVLARVLAGGRTLVLQAGAATVLGSLAGLGLGTWAATTHRRGFADLLARAVDALAALPALLVLLLLGAGVPGDDVVLAVAIGAVSTPFSVRVIRAHTARLAATAFAREAQARGDRRWTRLRHDILPGLAQVAVAEAGIRFVAATQLAATAGFLGLGAGAPAANWGRMVRENSTGIGLNALPVLVPAALLVVLAVGTAVLLDRVRPRRRPRRPRIDLAPVGRL